MNGKDDKDGIKAAYKVLTREVRHSSRFTTSAKTLNLQADLSQAHAFSCAHLFLSISLLQEKLLHGKKVNTGDMVHSRPTTDKPTSFNQGRAHYLGLQGTQYGITARAVFCALLRHMMIASPDFQIRLLVKRDKKVPLGEHDRVHCRGDSMQWVLGTVSQEVASLLPMCS